MSELLADYRSVLASNVILILQVFLDYKHNRKWICFNYRQRVQFSLQSVFTDIFFAPCFKKNRINDSNACRFTSTGTTSHQVEYNKSRFSVYNNVDRNHQFIAAVRVYLHGIPNIIRPYRMHGVQRCGLLLYTCSVVCVSACWTQP